MESVQKPINLNAFQMTYLKVVAQAWEDANFKQRFLQNPKAVFEELGISFAEEFTLKTHEMTRVSYHIVIPHSSTASVTETEDEAISPFQKIVRQAVKDPAFKAQLLANPKAVLRQELQLDVPSFVKVMVHEDTENCIHLVLPFNPNADEDELADEELEAVVGGKGFQVISESSQQNLNQASMNCGQSLHNVATNPNATWRDGAQLGADIASVGAATYGALGSFCSYDFGNGNSMGPMDFLPGLGEAGAGCTLASWGMREAMGTADMEHRLDAARATASLSPAFGPG